MRGQLQLKCPKEDYVNEYNENWGTEYYSKELNTVLKTGILPKRMVYE